MMMGDESGKNPRRLSQIFDPLSRLSELTRASHSTPSSPRLLPRRNRDVSSTTNTNVVGFDPLDAGCSANDSINWQERCLELQLELHRSRAQATRTRDMLREKVRELFFVFVKFRWSNELRMISCESFRIYYENFDWSLPFLFEKFHRHVRLFVEGLKRRTNPAFDLERHVRARYDFHLIKFSPFNVPLIFTNTGIGYLRKRWCNPC